VNEIDFCIAPADVSLSRAYGVAAAAQAAASADGSQARSTSSAAAAGVAPSPSSPPPTLSLTRALNNASNRAVRRILLARSWPSAEALNLSLRRAAEQQQQQRVAAEVAAATASGDGEATAKCPVPRPILNVLTRKRRQNRDADGGKLLIKDSSDRIPIEPTPRSRTDEEYVSDQIRAFRSRYGDLPGYEYAEAYLEAILSLATAGVESQDVVGRVLEAGVYDESYKRVVAVLKSVGATFENDPVTGRNRIASKLIDQDICLSMLDKLRMQKEALEHAAKTNGLALAAESKGTDGEEADISNSETEEGPEDEEDGVKLTREDLGGVLLSSEEPSVTRQLNLLSNIVQRALLFGGDQELLVLADTLDADRKAFVERWYPDTGGVSDDYDEEAETRVGVQFLNCLVRLLRDCYVNGVVSNLEPPLPLSKSYANSYERLVAGAVELGSGYLKPAPSSVMTMPKPRTAQEELGRFAVWESAFRQQKQSSSSPSDELSPYPDDLVGVWEVRDEIGGEAIGKSTVTFRDQGKVEVAPPLEGLRWRLDPGPTHLDTCTFQVLSSDGTILQYRGFLDRGARLESRFSKRPLRMRGSVMFQMRDGSIDYYKDMLPINYRTGTTKFVMTRQAE